MVTAPLTAGNAAAPGGHAGIRPIAYWLLFCCGMVFLMAVIGAVTRLTGSGLSMVEWKPLIGVLPPLSEAEWERVFGLYRQTPEYIHINRGMSLEEFRYIFYWEWFHRLWGHLIGIAFLAPFAWFLATRRIPRTLMPKLVGLFLLGGLQGVVGWFMVASGLIDRPSVSHYRLAMHLGIAFLIYALMLHVAAGLLVPAPASHRVRQAPALRRRVWLALALVGVTVVWGAFTAGLDAGQIYQTWPLMGDSLVPDEAWHLSPAWMNLFENHATVQFFHRWLAIAAAAAVAVAAWSTGRAPVEPRLRRVAMAAGAAVVVQVSLGIATLHSGIAIPVAAAHQAGALCVITLLVWMLAELRAPRPDRGRV